MQLHRQALLTYRLTSTQMISRTGHYQRLEGYRATQGIRLTLGKFICSQVDDGLQGFDNLVDVSELVGAAIVGLDSFIDMSVIVGDDLLGLDAMVDMSEVSIV